MFDVSIVTPTLNRATLLRRTWESISSQDVNFEWIVIDDGSTDDTDLIIKSFASDRINYTAFSNNRGVNAARNAGAKIATGRYVVFLDSDDELYPQSLAAAVRFLDEASSEIGVAGFACVIAETGKQIVELISGQILDEHDVVCKQALRGGDKIYVYRRQVFDEFLLPENLRGCEQVFVYQVSKTWKFLMINQPLSLVHRQSDNLSGATSLINRSSDIAKSYEMIIRNHAEILASCPDAEFEFLKKALYRYCVAGSLGERLNIYRAMLKVGSLENYFFATVLMIFGFLPIKYFEAWRIRRMNSKFEG